MYIYIYGEKVDIFDRSDQMKNKWNSGYTKYTNMSKRTDNATTSHAGIYSIPCKDCDKYYISEKNLRTQIIN